MAAPRRDAKSPAVAPNAPQPAPPYFIATEPLFIGGQFGRAHNVGDRVLPGHVEAHGWQRQVRPPDGYTTPDQPQSEPETPAGQATSSKEGDL